SISCYADRRDLHSFPTRRSSDLLDMIIGSGGVLSHAPMRAQSALMMMDAYQPEGITMLTVDSIFMMPHLGVLSEHFFEAAKQVRSEEHTSELQSRENLVCRLLLE